MPVTAQALLAARLDAILLLATEGEPTVDGHLPPERQQAIARVLAMPDAEVQALAREHGTAEGHDRPSRHARAPEVFLPPWPKLFARSEASGGEKQRALASLRSLLQAVGYTPEQIGEDP